jgi:hypothetical protein
MKLKEMVGHDVIRDEEARLEALNLLVNFIITL